MEVVPGIHWVDRIWDAKVYLLLDRDRVVIVDAAMPGRAPAIWQHLASLGYAPQDVDEIWLTHGDIDHMGSVADLKEGSGARVVAHRADAPLVQGQARRELGPVPLSPVLQGFFDWTVRRVLRYRPTVIDRAVEDGDRLGEWQVVHVPGHTAGSICFYHAASGMAIVGDAINHRQGRLGAPPTLFTPDMAQAYASIHRLAALDLQGCCFGHGAPLLDNARQRVQALADSLPDRM